MANKNISDITRTGFINYYAKDNNLNILSNKFTNQTNICLLLGNILGFSLCMVLPKGFTANMTAIVVLSIMNFYFAHKSVASTTMRNFNSQMASILIENYLETGEVMFPAEVNKRERLINRYHRNINFGTKSPNMLLKSRVRENIVHLVDVFREFPFFIHYSKRFSFLRMRTVYTINVFLELNASNADLFHAYFLAVKIDKELRGRLKDTEVVAKIKEIVSETKREEIEDILSKMEQLDWELDFRDLESDYNRYWMIIKES